MPTSGLDQAPDAILVARAVDGDVLAFEVLLRRYASLMTGYARKLSATAADADDAVQDAFITAWNTLDKLENPAVVKSWLMRIVGRKAIDRVRSRQLEEPLTELNAPRAEEAGPELRAELNSQTQAVAGILDLLPEVQRRCWLMRELGGYSYQEVATELQLPVSTVRGAIARARAALLRGMGDWA